jgi:hypothetical protein
MKIETPCNELMNANEAMPMMVSDAKGRQV